ncbi:MAG: hypothetical protein LBG14_06820, partial [Treponema sp.]|nr:hypothetical protein [Treponema sp.]
AGYYRSLLLLKNGVDRESLLGYSPDRFSAAVRERLDSPRIEQALSLLLDLYRDMRYSVSPRFELETAISKLSWLDRWVSPLEMRAAIADARNVLGQGGGGIAGPLAGPGRGSSAAHDEASRGIPDRPFDFNSPGAFSEAFRRRIGETAGRDKPEPGANAGNKPQEKPAENFPGDLPALREALIRSLGRDRQLLASGIAKTLPWEWEDPSGKEKLLIPASDTLTAELLKKELPLIRQLAEELWGKALSFEVIEIPDEGGGEERELPPQAELVRRLFRGTVVRRSAMEKNDGYQSL